MGCTAEQQAAFQRDGFLIYGSIVTAEELEVLRERIDALAAGDDAVAQKVGVRLEDQAQAGGLQGVTRRDKVWQITGAAQHDPTIARHAANPRILDVVERLLGTADLMLFTDQTLMKPAFHGSPVSWHQDSAYWTSIAPPALVSCWVALDDVTRDNGCMMMIPGSQTWGVIDHEKRDAFLHAQGVDLDRAVPVIMPAGACSFHHSLVVHGSGPNHTPFRRRGLVASYMRADSLWVGDPAKKPDFRLVRGQRHDGCV